eukprot:3019635-Prymnesium_polylepis.1
MSPRMYPACKGCVLAVHARYTGACNVQRGSGSPSPQGALGWYRKRPDRAGPARWQEHVR